MGKLQERDVIEFPDSTVNVKLSFSASDLKLLDETEKTETTEASHISTLTGSNVKFTATVIVLSSAGFLIILLHFCAYFSPILAGVGFVVIGMLSYEWQRMYASTLTRIPRASFNYSDLLGKNKEYIPFYTMGWLLGEKFKPFVMGCTPEQPDDRTPNEPEALSPERERPTDPKFFR